MAKYWHIECKTDFNVWLKIPLASGNKSFVDGYLTCLLGHYPRPEYRIVDSDGVIVEVLEKSGPVHTN
jgi:hypothetical protein